MRAAESLALRAVALIDLGGRRLQLLQSTGAGVDQRHIAGIFRGHAASQSTGVAYCARRGAQREQPLFDAFKLRRIEIRRDQCGAQVLVGFLQRVDGGIDRLTAGSTSAGALPRGVPAGAPPPQGCNRE